MKRFRPNARRTIAAATIVGALMVAPAIALASAGSGARPDATAATPLCQTPGLVIWLDTSGKVAAGTAFYHLHLTNLSGHACTLNGFPFLYAVNLTGHQVGPRASFRNELGLTLTTRSRSWMARRVMRPRLIRTGQVQSQSNPITVFQNLLCSEVKLRDQRIGLR